MSQAAVLDRPGLTGTARAWGLIWLLAAAAAILLAAGDNSTLPHSLEVWDNAARTSLPVWLMAWLGLLVVTFLGSLAFVRHHVAARWVLGGFVLSHGIVAIIEGGGLATMRNGLVSVTHVLGWTLSAVALIGALPSTDPRTPYGFWCRALLAIIAIAFVFDVRDAALYLYYQGVGHPALATLAG
jgi:hypothetical protein